MPMTEARFQILQMKHTVAVVVEKKQSEKYKPNVATAPLKSLKRKKMPEYAKNVDVKWLKTMTVGENGDKNGETR
jgi:hypothetical protein